MGTMKAAAAATLVRGWALALVLGQPVGAMAAPSERPGAEPPPSALFSGRFMDFERPSSKVVGADVPSWESPALVDKLPGHAVTHLLYAFLRMCGPGQLPKDAPRCEGKAAHCIRQHCVTRCAGTGATHWPGGASGRPCCPAASLRGATACAALPKRRPWRSPCCSKQRSPH